MRRAILIAALLAALAAPAAADIGVVSVSRRSARPGDVVVVHFGGYGREWPHMPAYLVPSARVPQPHDCRMRNGVIAGCAPFARQPPTRWPYVPIGRIHYGAPSNGRLRFRVPRIPSGTYHFVVYCAPCYRGPGGSLVDQSPTFSVLR